MYRGPQPPWSQAQIVVGFRQGANTQASASYQAVLADGGRQGEEWQRSSGLAVQPHHAIKEKRCRTVMD